MFIRILVAAVLPVILISFQNCSKVNFDGSSSENALKSNANGENYDGKVYVHTDTLNPCANQSAEKSIIVWSEKGYQLVKRNCVRLDPPLMLSNSEVFLDSKFPGKFAYQGLDFIFDVSRLSTAPDLNCVRSNFGPMDSVKVYSVVGSNGPMLVGQASAFGTVINLAFDDTVLDTSPTSAFTGTDQQGMTYLNLSGFDPSASYPSGGNTAFQIGRAELGAEGYLICSRPGGSL